MALVEALNFLRDKSPRDSKDGCDIPGRMLVLQHAWWLLNKHPNLQMDGHAASAIKIVSVVALGVGVFGWSGGV